jgi:hypothetical protein
MGLLAAIQALREPIPAHKRALLDARWQELPEELRVPWQVVGRHFSHCGYTMGPAYCSFGCTHCYLPKNANRVPLPSLAEMKAQIDANYEFIGHAGNLQITGGDVVDAYVRAGKPEELVEVLKYATAKGVVPMLMTHGQRLLEDPALLERLVREGDLRKLAVHIDITQGGRPGFPLRDLKCEADLHPLRQQFVDMILEVQKKTGVNFFAAHTITVTDRNLKDVSEIIRWLIADPRRLRAFRMISLQPEADVGRTLDFAQRASPEACWQELENAVGQPLPKDNLWFGHPKCSHMVTLLVLYPEMRVINMVPSDEKSRTYWTTMLEVMGGVGARGKGHLDANLRRLGLIARRPSILLNTVSYARHVMKTEKVSLIDLLTHVAGKRFGVLNVVQHNFMSEDEIRAHSPEVDARLKACSFRGAVKRNGNWQAVPMCGMNGEEREQLYQLQIETAKNLAA